MRNRKLITRLISVSVALVFLFVMGMSAIAQDEEAPAEETAVEEVVAEEAVVVTLETVATDVAAVQFNLDMTWLLLAGFLVFFMQAGFAMLEGGFIRHTGVVNSMIENFMDAAITGLAFFAVGYGIAYGTTAGGFFGTDLFFLNMANGAGEGDAALFVGWFFQFAFAGAAATIATGAMAERTHFLGKMMYSLLLGLFIYPVVVHWIWTGGGWLAAMGFHDFAGSTVVHQTGGIIALMGALIVGARPGRVFGKPPRPHNLMIATLGTFILWFGWYGFNVGSTLSASNPTIMGLTAVNTTLGAAAGSLSALFFIYFRTKVWDLSFVLNGSLAGLVAVTASCAFVSPVAAIIIGLTAGVVVVLAVDAVERAKIDDAVGAFAVHGACGMLGTLSIGFWGLPSLTFNGEAGLFLGGGFDLLITQAIGVIAVGAWAAIVGGIMFTALKAIGVLRMPAEAEAMGIDAYEHGASMWPDVLPIDEAAPAAGD